MCFWRCFYFLQVVRLIGPTVVSIGHCVGRTVQYIYVMLLVMVPFAIGMSYVYNGCVFEQEIMDYDVKAPIGSMQAINGVKIKNPKNFKR